ncbi:MAG: TonB-dependent receptor [Wenzhouxiangellaceae bacterium]
MKGRYALALLIGLLSLLAFSAVTWAQETSSSLRGRVIDQNGQPLAGITVAITHLPTGTSRRSTTNDDGQFLSSGLPVGGPYRVAITETDTLRAEPLENLFLTLGQAETVEVEAIRVDDAADLDTLVVTGANMTRLLRTGASSEFDRDDIDKMTAIDRDLKSILREDSKIVVDNTVDGGPGLSIAGSNIRYNSLTVDGIAQNDNFGLNKNGYPTRRAPISLDAIEALSVNITPFEVTYGSFLGGNINVVTKSGTNEFHGTGFFNYTDEGLTGSTSKGERLPVGDFEEKTWGFSLGGPIIQDKLFFFANYEKFDTTRAFPFSLDNQDGRISGTEIPNVTQSEVDQVVQIARNVYGFDALGFDADNDEEDEKILAKIDWNINDYHRASFTYQRSEGNLIRDFFTSPTTQTAALLSNRYNMNERLETYSFQAFSDWTSNFSTEIKVGFKDVATDQTSVSPDFPAMTVTTADGGVIRLGPDQFRHANDLDNDTRFLKFKGDYFLGDHTLTFGYEQEKIDVFNLFVPWSLGEITFDSLDDFAAGRSNFVIYGNAFSGNPVDAAADFSLTNHIAYLQDEWRITPDLTLFAGLRYETLANNDLPALNQDFVDRNGFSNQENLDGKDLWLPRFGFNWSLDDRTVIRGGAGLFGGGTPTVWLSNSYANTGVLSTIGFFPRLDGQPFTDIFAAVDDLLQGNVDGASAAAALQPFLTQNPLADTNAVDPDFEVPSSWKFNLAVDHTLDLSALGLGDGWLLTAEAIWSSVKNAVIWRETRRQIVGTAPDGRPIYNGPETGPNPADPGFDLILDNTSKGSSSVYTFDVQKNWFAGSWGEYDLRLSYTYQDLDEVNPGNAFIAFEGFGQPATFDRNADILYNSEFEIKNNITANLTWRKNLFGDNQTLVNLFYSGRSGRHFSYTFGRTFAFGGSFLSDFDNLDSQLLYVPSSLTDAIVTGDADTLGALDNFISNDRCLRNARGSIIERHACTSDWVHRLDLRLLQEIQLPGWDHKLELTFDIENLTNLIDSDWGRQQSFIQPFNAPIVDVAINDAGQYVYSNFREPNQTVSTIPSVWKMQLGIRYRF